MNIRNRRGLKLAAKAALRAASYDPKKLILIYTGASVMLGLILALLDYALQQQIGGTGGLGGVGIRSILETAQTVLMVGQLVAVLFWRIGYVHVTIRISRRESVSPSDLLEGFRKFGPVLRLRLMTTLLYSGVVFACVYLASVIFTFTPWAEPVMEAYEIGTEEAMLAAMEQTMLPLTLVLLAVMLVLLVPYYYRLRMAEFSLMDDPKAGAIMAIRKSRLLMYRNRLELFKLDVSFWWFYVLEMVTMVVASGDMILPMLGVELPWSATVSYYVFLVLCYLCQLALYWWRGNDVLVTYAMSYEALLPKEEEKDCA